MPRPRLQLALQIPANVYKAASCSDESLAGQAVRPVGRGFTLLRSPGEIPPLLREHSKLDELAKCDGLIEVDSRAPGSGPGNGSERVDVSAPQDDVLSNGGKTIALNAGAGSRDVEDPDGAVPVEALRCA